MGMSLIIVIHTVLASLYFLCVDIGTGMNGGCCSVAIQVPNHHYPDPRNPRNPAIFFKYICGTVQVFYTCTGILRKKLNRLIQARQTLL